MDGTCSMHGDDKRVQILCWKSSREETSFEDVGMKWMLGNSGLRTWIGFIWLSIGTGDCSCEHR